jgi:hypothetical protein
VDKGQDMRIFTGWDNHFGGSEERSIRKALVYGTFGGAGRRVIQNPLI